MKKSILTVITLFFFSNLTASIPASLDTSFNQTGTGNTPAGTATLSISGTSRSETNAITIDSSGNIIAAGFVISSSTSETNLMIARFLSNGALDTSFGTNGYVLTIPTGTTYSQANGIALDSSGNIIITGYATASSVNKILIARYTPAGVLDTTFNTSGAPAGTALITLSGTSASRAWGVAIQTNDNIVITGDYNNNAGIFVARILGSGSSAGTLDTSFNTTGFNTTLQAGITSRGYAIGLQLNGNILVTGFTTISSKEQIIIACFKSSGVLNNSVANLTTPYGTNGQGWTTTNESNGAYARALTVKSDGTAIAAGAVQTSTDLPVPNIIVQFTALGEFDNNFGTNGITTTQIIDNSSSTPTATSFLSGVQVEIDGSIIGVGGNTYQDSEYGSSFFIRYTNTGELDTTFTPGGYIVTDIDWGSYSFALSLQSDGKPISTGYASVDGTPQTILIRILPGNSLQFTNQPLGKYGLQSVFLNDFLYQNFYLNIITDATAQAATLDTINTILANYIADYTNQANFNYVSYLYLLEPELETAKADLINSYSDSEADINLFFSCLNSRIVTLMETEII